MGTVLVQSSGPLEALGRVAFYYLKLFHFPFCTHLISNIARSWPETGLGGPWITFKQQSIPSEVSEFYLPLFQ